MHFRKTVLALCCVISLVGSSRAQIIDKVPYVPPAPNAAALAKYAAIPVSLGNGTAAVSVPLFELEGRHLKVPVSISYHTAGIKVQDLSSSVGLGWVLNAGGVITRTVRGIADEKIGAYFGSDFDAIMGDASKFATTESTDTEPDLYSYNFNGKTGRFVLDDAMHVIAMPETNLRIFKPIPFDGTTAYWEILDTDGVSYRFGMTSNAQEQTKSTLSYPISEKTYTSSWYLSEITYPYSGETITFTYQAGADVYYEHKREETQYGVTESAEFGCGGFPTNWNQNKGVITTITSQITILSPKYLSSISTPTGSVAFGYEPGREDLPNALRLSTVTAKKTSNAQLKQYQFSNNSYFNDGTCSDSFCKRLKLTGIYETTNGTYTKYRDFAYNSTNLPSRFSYAYDHWGYFNANTYPSGIPTVTPYLVTFPGADKSPDATRAQANILTKVVNEVGGSQELYYQLNEYQDPSLGIVNTGGLRISQMVENDGTGINPSITKNFYYKKTSDLTKSSGTLYRKVVYFYDYLYRESCNVSGGATRTFTNTIVFSSSLNELFDTNGTHISYGEAQIEYTNGAKEQLFFTDFVSNPDDPLYSVLGFDGYSQDGPPFLSKGSRAFERGLLTEQIVFNAAGKKVRRLVNTYDFYSASALEAKGGKIMLLSNNLNSATARRGYYKQLHRGVRLQNSTEYTFDQTDETKSASVVTAYTYGTAQSAFPQTINKLYPGGAETRIKYKYPMDYFTSTTSNGNTYALGLFELAFANLVIPIEKISYVKNPLTSNFDVTDAELFCYKTDTGPDPDVTHIDAVYKRRISTPLSSFSEASIVLTGTVPNQYSTFTVEGIDFNSTSYTSTNFKKVHSYNSFDSYGQLLTEATEGGENYTYTYTNNRVGTMTRNPGTGEHASTFTNDPMVGLTQSVDPNSIASSYTYDAMNRLRLIKDYSNRIVSRSIYNYGSGTGALFKYSTEEDNDINFTTDGSGPTGVKYTWDFGDGVVVEDGGSTRSHAYASQGTYSAKLVTWNANGDQIPIMTTKSVTRLQDFTIAITTPNYGSTFINACHEVNVVGSVAFISGFTYQWQRQTSGSGSWSNLGSSSSGFATTLTGADGTIILIRCLVSDPNGNKRYSNTFTVNFQCDANGQCPIGCIWDGTQCICN